MKNGSFPNLRRLAATEAHHRLLISSAVAGLTLALMLCWFKPAVSLISAWDAFALTSLLLAGLGMAFTDARTRVQEAHLQDSSRTTISVCMTLASFVGLIGACVLLKAAKSAGEVKATLDVALAALTVVSSWTLVHTMMSLHYAHLFYSTDDETDPEPAGSGLDFPEEDHPDFLDFAYFSFVVGMTFQVSDVQVTDQSIRRVVLLHGLLSFAFNTVVVAFSINLAAALL
jgi:uncharacterized membrane protein